MAQTAIGRFRCTGHMSALERLVEKPLPARPTPEVRPASCLASLPSTSVFHSASRPTCHLGACPRDPRSSSLLPSLSPAVSSLYTPCACAFPSSSSFYPFGHLHPSQMAKKSPRTSQHQNPNLSVEGSPCTTRLSGQCGVHSPYKPQIWPYRSESRYLSLRPRSFDDLSPEHRDRTGRSAHHACPLVHRRRSSIFEPSECSAQMTHPPSGGG